MINTLEDMLVEVQKICPNAYIDKMENEHCHLGYIVSIDYWIDCHRDDGNAFLSIDFDNNKALWNIAANDDVLNSSDNPQDILDILRTIYNCGLPEEEKVNG